MTPKSLVPSKEMLQEVMENIIPFNRHLGMKAVEITDGLVTMKLPFKDEFIGDITKPAIHGGVLSALLDATGGAAVFTMISPGDRISTIDLLVDYLRPCPPETIVAAAKVVRLGGRVALVQLSLYAENDPTHLIATGRAAYNIKRGKELPA
ncbi:MAG: hotdog fold thioesterase [Deltaproteobacteria bacterium]|nr:hotdog fold thioesterase [Deltaproteobacteria bacterium]